MSNASGADRVAGPRRTGGRVVSVLSRENVSALVSALREGPRARSQLAGTLGLSPGTVTRLTSRLIDAGLVTEGAGPPTAGRGRPRVPLELEASSRVILAAHIGARRLSVGTVDLAGHVAVAAEVRHDDLSPDAVVARAVALMAEAREGIEGPVHFLGTGVGIGGWVSDGVVVEHPGLGWRNVDLARALSRAGTPPVRVDSHVRGLALAEGAYGAAREVDTLVELHVGNVTDAAVVVGGQLLRGPRSAAGRVGHLPVRFGPDATPCACGRAGCAQVELAEVRLIEVARELGVDITSAADLDVLADAGDERASRLRDERLDMIGILVGYLMDLLNPDLLVIAGSVSTDRAHTLERIAAAARRFTPGVEDLTERIALSQLRTHPLLLASAASVLLEYYSDPTTFEPVLQRSRAV